MIFGIDYGQGDSSSVITFTLGCDKESVNIETGYWYWLNSGDLVFITQTHMSGDFSGYGIASDFCNLLVQKMSMVNIDRRATKEEVLSHVQEFVNKKYTAGNSVVCLKINKEVKIQSLNITHLPDLIDGGKLFIDLPGLDSILLMKNGMWAEIVEEEGADEDEETYEIGERFIIEDEEYILANNSEGGAILICLEDGENWDDYIPMKFGKVYASDLEENIGSNADWGTKNDMKAVEGLRKMLKDLPLQPTEPERRHKDLAENMATADMICRLNEIEKQAKIVSEQLKHRLHG